MVSKPHGQLLCMLCTVYYVAVLEVDGENTVVILCLCRALIPNYGLSPPSVSETILTLKHKYEGQTTVSEARAVAWLQLRVEVVSSTSYSSLGAGGDLHVHLVFYDLEELPRLGDSPSFNLGPNRHVVQGDLERACADQLSFHGVK